MSDPRDMGELCRCCGNRYLTIYQIPDEAWEKITGRRDGGGSLCPACCDALMREAGLNPHWEAALGDFPLAIPHEQMQKEVPIRIYFKRLYGKGLASYLAGTYKKRAKIFLDLHALLNFLVAHTEWTWRELLRECVTHELLHVVEDILGRSFDDEEIERAIMNARAVQEDSPA